VLVRRGHTYVAAARLPRFMPVSIVRSALIDEGFVNVSVRAVEHPNYNAIGQGTWTGADQSVDLPSQVVFVNDITPAEVEPALPGAPAPAPIGPAQVGPSPGLPSPEPAPRQRRRAAPTPADPSVQIVAVVVAGLGAIVLWKLKRDGFWNRRAWR
jgi:cell division septation protein DedD